MVSSIKEKGVLEPILVRALDGGRFEIIAGERRYQASKIAGLRHVPAIEVDVDNRGMLEISMIENLQRKDLTTFEEAAAIQRLCDQFRYSHEEIVRKLRKARTVITDAAGVNRLTENDQVRCRQAEIESKSMLLQTVRQDSEEAMHQLDDRITGEGITREQARRFNRSEAGDERRPKRYVFR